MFHSRCIWGTFYAPCTHSWLCAACLVHHYLSFFDVDRREWLAVFVLAYNASSAMHTIRYKQEVRLVSLKHARVRLVDVKDELGIKSLPVNHSVVELANGVRRYRVDAAPEMNFHSLPQVVRARGVSEP